MCIVTIVFAACSSNDDDTADETTTTTTEAATEGQSLVEIAQGDENFSTLVDLVVSAGLVETLADGEFTVFAPTNDAFAALPEGTIDALKADTELLTGILTYHAVAGKVLSGDLSDGQVVTMANEQTITVNISDDGVVTLTDGSGNEVTVIDTDIEATNGVIHVIDGVLLPEGALS